MPWLHAPISSSELSSEVSSELFGRGNRTRPIFSSEVLIGVFWLAGKKTRNFGKK